MSKRPPSLIEAAHGRKERRPVSCDRPLHAATARMTAETSPAALVQAYADRAQHLLMSPDKQAVHHEGSWWPCWQGWLERHSGALTHPPKIGAPRKGYRSLCDAPGTYVLEP